MPSRTNVRSVGPTVQNFGLTRMDADGNMQLTDNFDTINGIFANHDTESWLSGTLTGNFQRGEPKVCKPELIVNRTSSAYSSQTLTVATEWELPTRPPGLDAIITSGMQGPRGQMVDVLVTTVKHQIRDSKGELLTDVALSPSKSEARTTTARDTSGGTSPPTSTPSTGLSTGAKAGIGAGVGIGAVVALLGAGLYLLRRRKSKNAVEKDAGRVNDESDGTTSGNKFGKAELATGPDVEAQPPAELHNEWMSNTSEVPGNAYPSLGTAPVELPVHERAVEMADAIPRREGAT
jgi:LPXTG-motif cell wall-anchored protein